MDIKDFKEYVKTRKALGTEEIHRFMDEMSNEARQVTFRLNTATIHPTKYGNYFPNCLAIKYHKRSVYSRRSMLISGKTLQSAKMYSLTPAAIFKTMEG